MMVRAAGSLADARRVRAGRGTGDMMHRLRPVAARIRAEATDNWDDQVAVDRFIGKGGTFVRGQAGSPPAAGPVGDQVFTARRAIVLAPAPSPPSRRSPG